MQWSDVRPRLTGGNPAAFGAPNHRWQLEPVLSVAELAELEAQLAVELPAEYRSFLLEAGRGGAGPGLGLFPARRVGGRWLWETIGDGNRTDFAHLGEPFEHTEAFNPEDDLPPAPPEAGFTTKDAWFDALREHALRSVQELDRPAHTWGLLYLCHTGCAYQEGLVVTGPSRGQMWADDMTASRGYRPLLDDDGRSLGFAGWYRRWLDEVTRSVPGPARAG